MTAVRPNASLYFHHLHQTKNTHNATKDNNSDDLQNDDLLQTSYTAAR